MNRDEDMPECPTCESWECDKCHNSYSILTEHRHFQVGQDGHHEWFEFHKCIWCGWNDFDEMYEIWQRGQS